MLQEQFRRSSPLIPAALAVWLVLPSATSAADAITPTDQDITDAVEDELFFDQGVDSHAIDVSTRNGIVTLEGDVENVLAKQRAERLAETVHGVLLIENEVEVDPLFEPSDEALAADVRTALLDDPAADSYELRVAVDDHAVTLSGTVDSLKERELALTVARGVDGVTDVRDEIVVSPKTERSRFELKPEIEKALQWNALVDDGLIDVKVEKNGRVVLSGTVGSAAEFRQARRTASIAGVTSVDTSRLEIEPWARDRMSGPSDWLPRGDDSIRTAVEHELMGDPRVSSFEVKTSVDDGEVTLRGTVDNLLAKRAAVQAARNLRGVERVHDRVKVRSSEARSQARIERTLQAKLNRNVFLDEEALSAEVENGVATLTGTVDNWFEKAEAENAAASTLGVEAVDNEIAVIDDGDFLAYDPWVDGAYYYDYTWYDYEPKLTFRTDAEILDDVRDEMFWSPFVDADEVQVRVDDGAVTLTGRVDTWSEAQAAVENAYEGGATRVINELEIESRRSAASQ